MMREQVFDVTVIGGGPGGYVAAIRAAQAGLKTAIVDERDCFGGTCLHSGCIPTKTFLAAANAMSAIADSELFGIKVGSAAIDWKKLQERKSRVIQTLQAGIMSLLRSRSVNVFHGRGMLAEPGAVSVDNGDERQTLKSRFTVLAPGSEPIIPKAWVGMDGILTSDDLLAVRTLPSSLTIVGGGVIGCEFASIFSRFGTTVHLVEIEDRLIPALEPAHTNVLAQRLGNDGVSLHLSCKVKELAAGPPCSVLLDNGESWCSEAVLMAIGRKPRTKGIGLEENGIHTTDTGAIVVDADYRTTVPYVFCIGDANGQVQLAHAAMAQARHVVRVMQGVPASPCRCIPWCVYTDPELASVGMTERGAKESGKVVRVGEFSFSGNGKSHVTGNLGGSVRVVRDVLTGEVLGIHIAGHAATEMIHAAMPLLGSNSTTDRESMIFAHPTCSEAIGEAIEAACGLATHMPYKAPQRVRGKIL